MTESPKKHLKNPKQPRQTWGQQMAGGWQALRETVHFVWDEWRLHRKRKRKSTSSMHFKSIAVIAWRNLWSRRSRAVLTIGAVTLGIAAVLFLLSLGFGLERLVTNQVANFNAFTVIDVPSANLTTGKITNDVISRIKELAHVVRVDPVIDLAGRVKLENKNATAETVVVAVPPEYFGLAEIPIEAGKLYEATAVTDAMANVSLAKLMGYDKPEEILGKTVTLDLVIAEDLRAKDTTEGSLVKTGITVTVIGLTNDNPNAAIFIPSALAEQNGVVNKTSLKIKVDSREAVPNVRASIENIGFSTEYVGDTVAEINQVFTLFRIILGVFGAIALVVSTLGTFNTLTISLIERIREIGLLKTLGMKRRDVFKLFVIESLTIGIVGGLLGILLGSVAGLSLNAFLGLLAQRAGSEAITVYYSPPLLIWLTVALAALIGLLTGLYPAQRAIKVGPLDVIRYE